MTVRSVAMKRTRLQKATALEYPANLIPYMRTLKQGSTFILGAQHVYTLAGSISMWSPFLNRFHWLSMQQMGDLHFPCVENTVTWLAETQLSVSERYIAAVKVESTKITVAAWIVSEEGFDPLPWSLKDGFIGDLVADGGASRYSHRPAFSGEGFNSSARYTAFSLDEKTLWTPGGAFNMATGEKTPLPHCFSGTSSMCATWSVHGQRLACLRGKTLEVYENDGRPVAVIDNSHVGNALIVDFSRSARYILVLETEKWRYSVFDVHQQCFSFLPLFQFLKNGNLLALGMSSYKPEYTSLSHSFSPEERYISCLIEDLSHRQRAVLAVWDRKLEEYALTQIWSQTANCRASHVQFDTFLPGILHVLINARKGGPGFIQVDLTDETTFACLRESSKTKAFSRFDICLNQSGGRAFQKLYYTLRHNADEVEEFEDVISWNLDKCPPEIEGRFTVRKIRDGWQVGYSQSNGSYGDWCMFLKDSSMAVVGNRVYSVSEKSPIPKPLQEFQPAHVWDRLLGDKEGENDEEIERETKDLYDNCFWSFLSPDESLICFYARNEYMVIFDVRSGDLRWCYRPKGSSADDYWMTKPVFHPTKSMMAWIEQSGKDGREDFSPLKHCGICISDTSNLDSVPTRLKGFTVDYRSDLLISPCGSFLYAGVIGRDDYTDDQRKFKISKIDLSSKTQVAYIAGFSPIKGPSYCGSPNPESVAMVFKDGEIHFLVSVEYKVMLAKIEFDGTIRWKLIASRPSPPKSPHAIALSGWNASEKGNRLDIVLAGLQFPCPTVINTWDETPDQWDEVQKVEHDDTF